MTFDNSEGNQLLCFEYDYFQKKFFGAFMRHIIRLNVGKEIKSFSELFIDKIFEYTFVTFEYEQTINSRNLSPSPSKKIQIVGGKNY